MRPTRITIHCTATENNKSCDISKIEEWHIKRGFTMVGYHAIIQPDGEIQNGRPLNMKGAHVAGENDNNIGIALVGMNFYSKYQFESLRYFIHGLQQTYDIKTQEIWCHYMFRSAQMQGKSCPNIKIQDFLVWYITGDYDAIEKYVLTKHPFSI